MYSKLFEQIFASSIAKDHVIRHVFMDLVVLADREGIVDMTIESIARITNVPEETVSMAIEDLMKPDSTSRTQEHDGKRLILLDDHRSWGWLIVNYRKYADIRDDEARREYFRNYKRQERAKKKPVVQDIYGHVGQSVDSEYETECKNKNYSSFKESVRENEDYVAEIRRLDWRDKESVTVEQEFAMQVSKGHAPAAIVAKLEQIHVWTNEGAYAPRLYEVIKRWQEPRHLWERKNDDERRAIPERTRVNLTALERFDQLETERDKKRSGGDR